MVVAAVGDQLVEVEMTSKCCLADSTKFRSGTAVTTTPAPIPVLLWHVGPDSYRLLPRSSFPGYVARRLLDSMQEFAGPGVP